MVDFTFHADNLWSYLGLLGLKAVVTYVIWLTWLIIYRCCFSRKVHLANYHGKWAVVTGATDGIGKAFAFELARYGINLVLVSRTKQKLDDVREEIKQFHDVRIKTIAVDFVKDDEEEYVEKIETGIEDVQVDILINNVGMATYNSFFHEDAHLANDLVRCNIMSMNNMIAIILPQMMCRKSGLIINVSSLGGVAPTPMLAVYSSTKAYVHFFTQCLEVEYRRMGVIFQCLTPGMVTTKMSRESKTSFTVASPEGYARAALSKIGVKPVHGGYWVHDSMRVLMSKILPNWLVKELIFRELSARQDKK